MIMFGKIKLTIYNPDRTNKAMVEVTKILTIAQVVSELISNEFISSAYNYGLLIESDGRVLSQDSTLTNIRDESFVRVVAFSERQIIKGKKINVTILHPSNGTDMEVELNDGLNVLDVINELIACSFIDDELSTSKYRLFIKNSQTEISGCQTLVSGGTIDGSVLRVIDE